MACWDLGPFFANFATPVANLAAPDGRQDGSVALDLVRTHAETLRNRLKRLPVGLLDLASLDAGNRLRGEPGKSLRFN